MTLKKLLKKIKSLFNKFCKSKIPPPTLAGVDSVNIGTIFILALTDSLKSIGEFFVLPIAAGTSVINAILQTHKSYVSGKKNRKGISNAVAAIVTAVGIVIAILFTLVGQSAFATIAPAILTGTLGAKALYELALATYHWYKYIKYKKKDPVKAAAYLDLAISNSVSFLTTSLSTAAVGTVLLAHKSTFSAFGIASGIIGAGYAGYKGYQTYKQYKAEQKANENEENVNDIELTELPQELSNNAFLHSMFAVQPETSPAPQIEEPPVEDKMIMENAMHTIWERTKQNLAEKSTQLAEPQSNTLRPV